MKPRLTEAEELARELLIAESLDAVSRLRVAVSVEDRVMAAVRLEAARNPRRPALSPRQKAVLSGAGAAAALGEAGFWVALGVMLLEVPLSATARALFGWIPGMATRVAPVLSAVGEAASALGRAALIVLNGLSLLLPSSAALAAVFLCLVSILTVIAVRRDLQRSPAARGLP